MIRDVQFICQRHWEQHDGIDIGINGIGNNESKQSFVDL